MGRPMKQASHQSDLTVYLQCSKCSLGYRLNPVDPGMSNLVGKLPCTSAGCKGRLKRVQSLASGKSKVISATDLYIALGGGGLPEERVRCTPKQLKLLMMGKKITSIQVEEGPGYRSFIRSITLEGGNQVHLGISTKGPTVYKVTMEAKNVSR
jgi:hypothetical protein